MVRLSNRPQLNPAPSQGLNFTVPSWSRGTSQSQPAAPTAPEQFNRKDVQEIKKRYLQQNTALARTNSVLRNGMNELEKQVQQLNTAVVSLQTKQQLSEADHKKQMDEQLAILENGILSKLRDVFTMFDNIRERQGLPPSGVKLEFGAEHEALESVAPNIQLESLPSGVSDRRRKSSARRQSSLFIHSPDTPEVYAIPVLTPVAAESTPEEPTKSARSQEAFESAQQKFESLLQDYSTDMSISDYSIPEESPRPKNKSIPKLRLNEASVVIQPEKPANPQKTPQKKQHTNSKEAVSPLKKQHTNSKEAVSPQKKPHPKPKETHQKKQQPKERRKTLGAPIPREVQELQKELTPEIEGPRESRRRKPVNYALPSLRKKMRRQSEKFVDAVFDPNAINSGRATEVKAEAETLQPAAEPVASEESSRPSSAEMTLKTAETLEMIPAKPRRTKSATSERKPLSNVTSSNNVKRNSLTATKTRKSSSFGVYSDEQGEVTSKKRARVDDMSIFDFVDNPEEFYVPNKRKTSFGNDMRGLLGRQESSRRHSMM